MPKPRIQSRVDPHIKRGVEDFASEHDMTQAEAVRALVSAGLRDEEDEETSEHRTSFVDTLVSALTSSAVVAVAAALFGLSMITLGLPLLLSFSTYTMALVVGGGFLFMFTSFGLGVAAVLAHVAVSSTPPEKQTMSGESTGAEVQA